MNPIVILWESENRKYRVSLNSNAMYTIERMVGSTQRHVVGTYERLAETFTHTNLYHLVLDDSKVSAKFKKGVILNYLH